MEYHLRNAVKKSILCVPSSEVRWLKDRVLISTNTYFQLITAVHLKLTRFRSDDVDVIVTAHSANSKIVADRLRTVNLFRNVYYIEDRDGRDDSGAWDKYKRYGLARVHPRETLSRYAKLNTDYNIFLFNNTNFLTFLIWLVYRKNIRCYRFEEGFSTYTKPFLNKKKQIRGLLITAIYGNLENHVDGLFLFHPELFHQAVKYPIIKIDPLNRNDEETKKILNHIFDYTPVRNAFPEKYIFMEESFRASGVEMDDVELVMDIVATVGRENLIVKPHPRSDNRVFQEHRLKVSEMSQIPWEVILLNEDFSDKVLLTITSGSVLASTLYFEQPIKAYLLFNCVKHKSPMLDDAYLRYITEISSGNEVFTIPQDKTDLFAQLTH